MQPCPVCGTTTIDATGRCTRCGTFRGQPYHAAPPVTVPVGYPGYPPPQPRSLSERLPARGSYQPRRSSFAPLIAAVSAAVVLIAAIVVVVVVKSGKHAEARKAAVAENSPSPSPSPSSLVDPCVVGTWKVTSDEMVQDFGGTYGKVTVTLKESYTIKLRADGTGVEDMGAHTIFQGLVNSTVYTIGLSGTDTYSYRTSGSTLTISDAVANGNYVLLVNSKVIGTGTTVSASDPVQYTCSGDTMTEQRGTEDSMRMTRLSHDA